MPRPILRSRARDLVVRSTAALASAAVVLISAAAFGSTSAAGAPLSETPTPLLNESFRTANAGPGWVRPNTTSGNNACLTSDGDPIGSSIPNCWWYPEADTAGALMLNFLGGGQSGGAYYQPGVPTGTGIDITFNSYQWDRGGFAPADGLSLVLTAADPDSPSAPATLGPPGDGLGYANSSTGVVNGYLGVGFDVIGNFAANTRAACPSSAVTYHSVTVRGPGAGSTGYCALSTTRSLGSLDAPDVTVRPAAVPVQVAVNPQDHAVKSRSGLAVPARSWLVSWTGYGAARQSVTGALPSAQSLQTAGIPTAWIDPQTNVPRRLVLGLAGATGAGFSRHAVNDLDVTTLGTRAPTLGLVMGASPGSLAQGAAGTVMLHPSVGIGGGALTGAATVTTTLPAGLVPGQATGTDSTCTTTGQVVSCTTSATQTYAAGTSLPPITIPVTGTAVGNYTVTASASAVNAMSATATHPLAVTIPQAITFTPLTSPAVIGTPQTLSATGGASGQPVTFTVGAGTTTGACSISGTVLSFAATGTCIVAADQAGTSTYAAAPQVVQTLTVDKAATSTTLTVTPANSVYGQSVSATATVTGATSGTVQFSVGGQPAGAPVALQGGIATSGALAGPGAPLLPGNHPVTAVFTPSDTSTHEPSTATPQVLTVAQAATTTTVTVAPTTLTARVHVTAPGSGDPTGLVTFTVDGDAVGTAPVVNGVATLSHTTAADKTRQVAALYPGDASHLASSGSTARANPVLKATLTSPTPRSRYGWYRSAVTVTFTCTGGSAPLAAACPAPVKLTRNGASQSLTRTVTTTDGGIATVAVAGINIDATAPTVALTGVTRRGRYFAAAPVGKCVGADRLSGLATCAVTRKRVGEVETITATATDRAGNVATTRMQVTVVPFMIAGASYSNGVYTLRKGRAYTLLAASTVQPRYVDAAWAPKAPKGLDNWFRRTGRTTWALGVVMDRSMRTGYWNIGIKTGSRVQVVKVYVRP